MSDQIPYNPQTPSHRPIRLVRDPLVRRRERSVARSRVAAIDQAAQQRRVIRDEERGRSRRAA